jgi:hypothetical protein
MTIFVKTERNSPRLFRVWSPFRKFQKTLILPQKWSFLGVFDKKGQKSQTLRPLVSRALFWSFRRSEKKAKNLHFLGMVKKGSKKVENGSKNAFFDMKKA